MNSYVQALLAKFLTAAAVAGVLLLITGAGLATATLTAFILILVLFLAADLPFIPLLGANLALIADLIVAVPLLWGITWYFTGTYLSLPYLILLALIVAAGEWVFHFYAAKVGLYPEIRRRIKN